MARSRSSTKPPKPPNPTLIQPRDVVRHVLTDRIEKGRALQTTEIQSETEVDNLRTEQGKWAAEYRRLWRALHNVAVEGLVEVAGTHEGGVK